MNSAEFQEEFNKATAQWHKPGVVNSANQRSSNIRGPAKRVTVILKDLTDAFYEGCEHGPIIGFNTLSAEEKFWKLNKDQARFPMKIANGQFRDKVELNQILRAPHEIAFALLPRKGYKIAEFIVSAR